jgi:hypothetical protein
LQGVFLNHAKAKGDIIKVFPEAKPSKDGRTDLVIQKLHDNNGKISEQKIIIMKLKYAKNSEDVYNILRDVNGQVMKYESHLEYFTDLTDFTIITALFDRTTGKIRYEVHEDDSTGQNTEENVKRSKISKRSLEAAYKYRSLDLDIQSSISINNYSDSIITSGSAKVEFWPIRVLKGTTAIIGNAMKYLYSAASAGRLTPFSETFGPNDHDRIHGSSLDSPKMDHINIEHEGVIECVPYIWDQENQEYATEYVADCSLSHGNIKIFSNIHQAENNIQIRDYHLLEDSYQNCRPIKLEGHPSVYCEGEKSNMVYTENVQLPFPSLDAINAQLMLARAFGIDKLIGELTTKCRIFLGLEQGPTNKDRDQEQADPKKEVLVKITAQQCKKWQDDIKHIECLIAILSSQALQENNKLNLKWANEAKFILQDHQKEINNLTRQQSLVLVREIADLDAKLEYLKMDLAESFDLPAQNIADQVEDFVHNDNQQHLFNSVYGYPTFEHLSLNILADNSPDSTAYHTQMLSNSKL